jgi:uncharacterized membrane protein YgcG
MNRVVLVSFAGCAAVLLAACGAEQHQSPVDPKVRASLVTGVNRVESAARGRDRAGAELALAGLTRDIATRQARGQLDPDTAQKMLAAADRVAEDVRTLPAQSAPGPADVAPVPSTSGPPASSGEGSGGRHRGSSGAGNAGASGGAGGSGNSASSGGAGARASRYHPVSVPQVSSAPDLAVGTTSTPTAPRLPPEAAGAAQSPTARSQTAESTYGEASTSAPGVTDQ